MRLTTKSRYAVTAMLDLALYAKKKPVALAEIADRQGLSVAYLEQLFSRLRHSGLVRSVRGPGGGYYLGKSDCLIYISDIIGAVDESIDATKCSGKGDCHDGKTCLTHHLWCDLNEQIYSFLNGVSIADLTNRKDIREVARNQKCVSKII